MRSISNLSSPKPIHRRSGSFLFATALVALVTPLLSSVSEANANPKTHDGVYVRLSPGIAVSGASATTMSNEVGVGGISSSFNFGVGYALSSNILVGAAVSSQLAFSPKLSINDTIFETEEDVSFGIHLAGAEASYYLTSLNLYFSGSMGALVMTASSADESSSTEIGIGGGLTVGKEWWVSPQWGVGLAAKILVGSVSDEDDLNWTASSFGLALSATYN